MSEENCLEFPSFEAFDAEDRPPPPSEEEYPIGCEVELVDIGPARIAQTDELWEPFMDDFFNGVSGGGRRQVRVVRHQGDYTFVVCDTDPEMIIGCTLYRACLSEPKVRFKKYIPHQKSETNIPAITTDDWEKEGDNLLEVFDNTNEEVDRDMGAHRMSGSRGVSPTDPLGLNKKGSQRAATLLDTAHRPQVMEGDSRPKKSKVDNVNLSRRKYNYAMKKGYEALTSENYTTSVYYYNKALKYADDGGVKVFSNRSVAFLGLRNTEAAFNDAMRVIELRPQSILGYVRAGNTLRGMNKFEDARFYYEKALEIEPDNETLKFLIKSDTLMMIYASKVEHRRVANVTLDKETMNVILVSKRDLVTGATAWAETTNSVTLLGGISFNDDDITGSSGKSLPICGRCNRPLTRIEDFCKSLPELDPSLIAKMYHDPTIVECNGRCGVLYCSESCRSKAWAGHHWVECKNNGKWSDAFRKLPTLLKSFVDDHKITESRKRHANSAGSNRTSLMNTTSNTTNIPIVHDTINIVVRRVLLACRMLACIVSNGRPLPDAVQIYEWMLPQEDKHRGGLKKNSTNLTEKVISGKILTSVHTILQECFSKEEHEHLTFNFFLRCYEHARDNSVRVRISLWPSIQQKAESYIELFKIRGLESNTSPPSNSANNSNSNINNNSNSKINNNSNSAIAVAGCTAAESRMTELENIVATPAESVAGYFECLALFEVFALTFQPQQQQQYHHQSQQSQQEKRKHQHQQGGVEEQREEENILPRYNVSVRPAIEAATVIHVVVMDNIAKGEQLTADRAVNAFIV
ncbi:Tetratricopeptide repeat 2 [Trypanosoma melophagium]|uniref:Tetratricopeptide repeat 2 n=1 Tax=Trypanosoma melophagium TaxID=715481 RepID=UPI003519E467|nr:Tetratricopeptide repeat 2 [Trypanosoma melophagium]